MKKRNVLMIAAVVIAGVIFGLQPAGAGKPDRGPKPPKKAVDQMRSKVESPNPDPEMIGGQLKPDATGLALILRDPETGDLLRDADGKPQIARNPDGSVKLFLPEQVPEDQKKAQAKHSEKVQAAGAGDRAAQAHLENEQRKTQEATRR